MPWCGKLKMSCPNSFKYGILHSTKGYTRNLVIKKDTHINQIMGYALINTKLECLGSKLAKVTHTPTV